MQSMLVIALAHNTSLTNHQIPFMSKWKRWLFASANYLLVRWCCLFQTWLFHMFNTGLFKTWVLNIWNNHSIGLKLDFIIIIIIVNHTQSTHTQ